MFYFPIINTTYPEWMPFVGGESFRFFNAIFNVADISITIGVLILLISLLVSPTKKEGTKEKVILTDSQNSELDNSIQ